VTGVRGGKKKGSMERSDPTPSGDSGRDSYIASPIRLLGSIGVTKEQRCGKGEKKGRGEGEA